LVLLSGRLTRRPSARKTTLARWKTGAHGKNWGVIFANASMLNRQSVGGLLQAQHELALLKAGGARCMTLAQRFSDLRG
jgi:hypothetical protein